VFSKRDLGLFERLTQTMFFQKSVQFLWLDFGYADDGRSIYMEVLKRIPPSFFITLPMFLIGLLAEICLAMTLAYFRGSYLDFGGVVLCVIMMSISIMFYVIGGQWFFDQISPWKFVVMPVVLGAIAALGSGARWYRTIFLEEVGKDYVRTARMKGLPEGTVLYKHALKNAMIPILTSVIVSIPFLFLGTLILESFFAIPGMGNFTIEAINRQDFAIVQAMVVLGSYLYILGLILTDISYTLVDPRVRLQ
jgi:peptide/nickel transport system permease protein